MTNIFDLFNGPDFSLPRPSEWMIHGASGLTVGVETPVVEIEVGGSYLRMPLWNTRTKQVQMLQGGGLGGGFGVGLSIPLVNASGSLDSFPSGGIGNIFAGLRAPNDPMLASDFEGYLMVCAGGAGWTGANVEVGVAVWSTVSLISSSNNPIEKLLMPLYIKAVGLFVAAEAKTHLAGAGVTGFQYVMVATD